jgi:cytochrome c-type biogenesis protein CcmE
MNKKYLIGGIVIITFIVLAMFSFQDNTTEFVTIAEAKASKETVQVYGHWLKDKESNYNAEKNQFEFYMEDEAGNTFKVIHTGAKPNNFEIASKVVVKGHYESHVFKSNQILTKCPSKYEGTIEELQES